MLTMLLRRLCIARLNSLCKLTLKHKSLSRLAYMYHQIALLYLLGNLQELLMLKSNLCLSHSLLQALYRSMTSYMNLNLANMCHQTELLFQPGNSQALEHMLGQALYKLEQLGIVQAQAVYKLL